MGLSFERDWLNGDLESVLGYFSSDCVVTSVAPFPRREEFSGKEEVHEFVRSQLSAGVHVDATRTQVCSNRIVRSIEASEKDTFEFRRGTATVNFEDSLIVGFHLKGPETIGAEDPL